MSIDNVSDAANPGDLVKDTSIQGFQRDVLAESMKLPVLVELWSPWREPSKQLAPILEKLVRNAGGRIKLARLNVDENPGVAEQLGIKSVPAVVAFHQGQLVDGFMGSMTEPHVKSFIERLTGPIGPTAIESMLEEAAALAESGDAAGAANLYAQVLGQDAENVEAIAAIAKLHIDLGDTEGAKRFLEMAPANKANDPLISAVRAALELAEQASDLGDVEDLRRQVEEDPKNYQARFDLAAALNARNKREEATDLLLDIVRRDRTWNDDGARKQLVQFFEAWGPMDEATIEGRKRLSSILFA